MIALFLDTLAADEQAGTQRVQLAHLAQLVKDLNRELACRRQHEGPEAVELRPPLAEERLDELHAPPPSFVRWCARSGSVHGVAVLR